MAKRKKLATIIVGLILALVCVQSSLAQQRPSQSNEELKALEAIKEGQTAIQKQLQEIIELLKARPAAAQPTAPRDIVLDLAGEPVKGEKTAKVVLVDFSDYQ